MQNIAAGLRVGAAWIGRPGGGNLRGAPRIGAARQKAGERMGGQIEMRCRCGEVRGTVTKASPRSVNRVTCYCEDCQAFAHQLGRADLLNEKGGSDVVQVAPAALTFTQGRD